jgi:ComF family protein
MRYTRKTGIRAVLEGMVDWIYPDLCMACEEPLHPENESLCLTCLLQLTPLDICGLKDNYVAMHFWGRVRVEQVYSLFNYFARSRAQKIIHQIKYRNKKQLAIALGRRLAEHMERTPCLPKFDIIVPVPLHPRRVKERGYNQSALISKDISGVLNIQCAEHVLKRKYRTISQTRLNRAERISNMLTAFELSEKLDDNVHVLLIDDVITTGATLEGCIVAIQNESNRKVSVATIAAGGGF